jgi:hypothetical protein
MIDRGQRHKNSLFSGFSNDPYLAGALGADTVEGIQSVGVTASTKVCCSISLAPINGAVLIIVALYCK